MARQSMAANSKAVTASAAALATQKGVGDAIPDQGPLPPYANQ